MLRSRSAVLANNGACTMQWVGYEKNLPTVYVVRSNAKPFETVRADLDYPYSRHTHRKSLT